MCAHMCDARALTSSLKGTHWWAPQILKHPHAWLSRFKCVWVQENSLKLNRICQSTKMSFHVRKGSNCNDRAWEWASAKRVTWWWRFLLQKVTVELDSYFARATDGTELLQSFPDIKKLCLKLNTALPAAAAAACAGFCSCAGLLLTSNQNSAGFENKLVLKRLWTVQHFVCTVLRRFEKYIYILVFWSHSMGVVALKKNDPLFYSSVFHNVSSWKKVFWAHVITQFGRGPLAALRTCWPITFWLPDCVAALNSMWLVLLWCVCCHVSERSPKFILGCLIQDRCLRLELDDFTVLRCEWVPLGYINNMKFMIYIPCSFCLTACTSFKLSHSPLAWG